MQQLALVIALAAFAYVLGSVPWGLVIARTFCGVDPREAGSHNTGATNVARLCGFGWGVATLACDLLKGAFFVCLALLEGVGAPGITVIALAAILGHVFSCFMQFRGGKAVATSIGVFLPIAFIPLLIACVLCIVVIGVSGFVSLGSLTLVVALPILLILFGRWEWLVLALCVLAVVTWRHKENIIRLRAGQEKPWLRSRQKDAAAAPEPK